MMLQRDLPVWGGALVCLVLLPAFAGASDAQAAASAPAKGSPIVEAPAGKIEGQLDGKLRVFKGIPFALPPVGQARWKPPFRCLDGQRSERRRNSGRPAISPRSRSRRSTHAIRCR